jgi:acyl-coenzyme A synthetase/AMP-(fatty) acid ligase
MPATHKRLPRPLTGRGFERAIADSSMPDGYLFVTGRIKEAMVTADGGRSTPDEIEPWYRAPDFAEVAVVPGTARDGNDRPVLVLVPAGPSIDREAIRRTVASLRAAAPPRLRVAGSVCRAEPLPRTAAGRSGGGRSPPRSETPRSCHDSRPSDRGPR